MSATLTPETTRAGAAPTAADAPAAPAPTRPPRVLVVSTMFPNPAQPVHAVFVYRRVGHVAERCDVRVLAPVPWFPFATRLGRYAQRRGIPERAKVGALEVRYPRFLSVPRFLKPLDPWFLFLAVWREVRALRAQGFEPDVIDAHLAWPDGAGARLLARVLGKPLTITLRGHDVNEFPRYPWRRRQIVAALRDARRVMAVADALRRAAVELGCAPEKTETIPNGVVMDLFVPRDRREARARLGLPLDARIVLSVGHLVERKGHHIAIEAVGRLRDEGRRDVRFVVVGAPGEEGNYLPVLEATRERLRLQEEVTLAGAKLNEELPWWYAAADVMVLASSKEGWANVLLESLACGTPVVATNVWGTPEVICSPDYGILVDRTAESIADGIGRALDRTWDRDVLVRYARTFSWHDVARKVERNYRLALGAGHGPTPVTAQHDAPPSPAHLYAAGGPVPPARDFFFPAAPRAPREEIALELAFFRSLRMANGTYKTTATDRMREVDATFADLLPRDGGRPLEVLDIGVSSGITTLELLEALDARGIACRMTAVDITVHARLRRAAPGLDLLLDSAGHVLQIHTPLLTKGRPHDPETSARRRALQRVFDGAERAFAGTPESRPGDVAVQLITPRLLGRPDATIVEHDATRRRDEWVGKFDAARAANILNLSYFDRATLTAMLAHLRDYLKPGGLLDVCRTLDDGTNHATIFRRAADGRLEPVARHGDGSEVEELAVALPPAR